MEPFSFLMYPRATDEVRETIREGLHMAEPFRLDGKVAFITGAGSGIGEQAARLFARQGAIVAVADVNAEGGQRVVAAITGAGGAAAFVAVDVTNAASVGAAIDAVTSQYGRLDIGVNNAGIGMVGDVLETSEEDFDRLWRVNVKGVYLCAQAEVRWMAAHGGGCIVNTASVAGIVGVDRRFAYTTTKGAVTAMTKQLALDHVKDGIRVNCVNPGTVETPFVDAYLARYHAGEEEQTRAQLRSRQLMGRLGQPDEVAHAMLYLASDEAAFVTGTALVIDGGLTAR